MPQAIAYAASAAATYIGAGATTAAVIGYGAQLAVSYAVTNYATKKSQQSAASENQERTIEAVGGDSIEKVIYGRAKVSGTRYMLQKYNGYIYHGIALCRHPIEEIEAIYFDDKLSTHPDYSNVELAEYDIVFSGLSSHTGDVTVTVDDVDYIYTKLPSDTYVDVRDGIFALMTDTTEFTFEEIDDDTIKVTRTTGGISDWDITISADPNGTDIVISITKIKGHEETEKQYRIIVEYGNQTTANSALVSELDFDDVTHRWTNNHRLEGVSHINIRWSSSFLRDKIGRLPAVTVVLKGKNNIYDPRDSQYKYTTNPALIIRDWLKQPYAFDSDDILLDDNKWIPASNICDEQVFINESGVTQDRYSINTVVSTASQPSDVLSTFSSAIQAPIIWSGGGWVVKPTRYEIPEIELTEDDFAGNLQFTDKPSIQDRFNQVQGTFINPLQEWSSHDYPSVIVEDGLSEKVGNLSFTTEIDYIRAQRLAQLNLLLNYASAATQIKIKRLNKYIPVDSMIYLTVNELEWDKKTFYVANREDHEDATATLTLLPRQAEMFDWDYTQAQEVDTITSEPIFDIREELT